MTLDSSIYQPRHAGQTAKALALSAARREQVDTARALRLLNTQIDQGNDTAIALFIRLRPLERLHALAGAA